MASDEGNAVDVEEVAIEEEAPEVEEGARGDAVEDVMHSSGCDRFCNSLFTAFCVAPAVFLLAMLLLGWNERRAVCDQRAIAQGKEEVLMNDCVNGYQNDGQLVMFQCDLLKEGLADLMVEGDFAGLVPQEKVVGLSIQSEMLQCVEEAHTETTKDSVGGGTTTKTTYTYRTEWRSSAVSSQSFRARQSTNYQTNCGTENPGWPTSLPRSGTQYVNSAMLGPYTLSQTWVQLVPLDQQLQAASLPQNWSESGAWYEDRARARNDIGDIRIRFMGNDWGRSLMTGLGKNSGASLARWMASDSWMCSGFTLGTLRRGAVDKDALFQNLEAEAHGMTVVLRIIGFVLMWVGLISFFKPLGVAADCIPFLGPYLGDGIEKIVACVTCPLACGCASGVIGVVWVFMRPMVGIPLVIVCCVCTGGFVGWEVYTDRKKKQEEKKKKEAGGGSENGPDPEAAGQS